MGRRIAETFCHMSPVLATFARKWSQHRVWTKRFYNSCNISMIHSVFTPDKKFLLSMLVVLSCSTTSALGEANLFSVLIIMKWIWYIYICTQLYDGKRNKFTASQQHLRFYIELWGETCIYFSSCLPIANIVIVPSKRTVVLNFLIV